MVINPMNSLIIQAKTQVVRKIFGTIFLNKPLNQSKREEMTQTTYFPNLAWGFFSNKRETSLSNPEVLQGMKACGLNLAGFVLPADLDTVHAAGLKAFVYDPRTYDYNFRDLDAGLVRQRVASLVAEVSQHPALAGYCIKDEPHSSEFKGLAVVAQAFRELDPLHLAYINLFPDYASQEQLGTETYEDYVAQYIQIVRPTFISYDHYALFEDAPLRKSYFSNMEVIRRLALQNQLPFWNIVLGNSHFTYAEPTLAGLRFQLFTTLAYGGKGISWFTYIAPEVGNYRLAPLDQFGKITPTWHYLQNVSLQLEQLAPTLLQLNSQRVYHFGDLPEGCRPAPASAWVKEIRGSHQQFLVGEFTHNLDESRYILLVNKDLKHSSQYQLNLDRSGLVIERVSPYNGQLEPLVGEDDWLAPGQGVLIRISSKGSSK